MKNKAHGFSLTDHRRVARLVRKDEQGLLGPGRPAQPAPAPTGLTRVMLLREIETTNAPNQRWGDYSFDRAAVPCAVTVPIEQDYTGSAFHFAIRCADAPNLDSIVARTWQLTVIPPAGTGDGNLLTEPIPEFATAKQVEDAINATGCPTCGVIGPGMYLTGQIDGQPYANANEQVQWPGRVWHVVWPDSDWRLTLRRTWEDGGTHFDYQPGDGEVPIQLIETGFAPTPFWTPVGPGYQYTTSPPLPGSFALAQPLRGFGLVFTALECWQYAD